MITNLHTHTKRCHHAVGEDRAYVEAAIRAGIRVLGFSDHSPQFYSGGYISHVRMTPEEASAYVESIRALAREYADDVKIFVGFEAEYYAPIFPQLSAFCQSLSVDYLILGQHYLGAETSGLYSGHGVADADSLNLYADMLIEAMETGKFTYVAHPDVLNYTGDDEALYRDAMLRICRKAKEMKIPLEYNLLGLAAGRHYPCDRFFRIAAEVGNDIIIGRDAHDPSSFADVETERKAIEYLDSLGLHRTENPVIRRPY